MLEKVRERLEHYRERVLRDFIKILSIPAVNPSMGGLGEYRRGQVIQEVLESYGFSVERMDSPDESVPEGVRPNLYTVIDGGDSGKTLWLVAHMDTVPEGDRSLWKTDPFKPVVSDGKIICRGSEDNGQGLASSILALLILRDLNPPTNVGLAVVSDEEAGSRHGIEYLLGKGLFREGDEVIVPDYGTPKGDVIEVAEKHLLWLKFTVEGRQVHASIPEQGLNAHRIGMRLALALDSLLHERYSKIDPLFEPPQSTFEPTKKEKNIDNINTVPGTDIFYFDCRILPEYDLDEVLELVKRFSQEFCSAHGSKVDVEVVVRTDAALPTPPEMPIVRRLAKAIEASRGFKPRTIGIGGGTCATFFRRRGIPAPAWYTTDMTAHQPNEYCKIDNLVADAETLALTALISE